MFLLAIIAVAATAMPAWAQYPPQRPTCQVDRTVVEPGDEVQVTGQGWQENSSVRIRFRQDPVTREYGPFPTDDQGNFSARIRIPENAREGEARIVVGGPDQNGRRTTCTVRITVSRDGTPPPPPRDETIPICAVDDATPAPGQTLKVYGRQWLPRSTVEIHFHQEGRTEHLATANVNPAGRFAKASEVPEDAEEGPAEIVVTGRDKHGRPAQCRIEITVTSSSSNAAFAVEPPLSPGAVVLLAGTAGVVALSRRRRARALAR